jgi:putative membrane protein
VLGLPHQAVTDRGTMSAGAVAVSLGCAGVAAQLCYPLADGTARDLVTVAVVLLLAGACVTHAAATRGVWWATGLVLVTTGGGLSAEFVGTATGFPFGSYAYTAAGALGPESGTVPLLIGPAWTLGTYLAWCGAQAVAGTRRGAVPVLVAAWGLASWDLYLDPQMVADGRWVWTDPDPALPGVPLVPLSNYAGWLLVALVLCSALSGLDRALGAPRSASDGLPLALFCWTWLGSAVAHAVFLGLPASAGYGLVGMGLIGVPLLGTLVRPRSGVTGRHHPESPVLPAGPEPGR